MKKKKETLSDYSLEELLEFGELLSKYRTIRDLKSDLKKEISRKDSEIFSSKLNEKFDLVMLAELNIFTLKEIQVLYNNSINNLDELLSCDLDSIVGATCEMKRRFEWARHFYDMSRLSLAPEKAKKKTLV